MKKILLWLGFALSGFGLSMSFAANDEPVCGNVSCVYGYCDEDSMSCICNEHRVGVACDTLYCPDGTIEAGEGTYCEPCSAGTYESGGVCLACSGNAYSAIDGATTCENCANGTTANSTHTACIHVLGPVTEALVSTTIADIDPCTGTRLLFTGYFSFADLPFTGYASIRDVYYPLYGTSSLYIGFLGDDFGITGTYISTHTGIALTIPYVVVNSGTLDSLSGTTNFILNRSEVCPRIVDDVSLTTNLLPGGSTFNGWHLGGFIVTPPNSNANPQSTFNPSVKKQKKKRKIIIPKLHIGLQLPSIGPR